MSSILKDAFRRNKEMKLFKNNELELYKENDKLFHAILTINYPRIEIDGRHNTLNFYQTSMFSWCDPILILQRYRPIHPFMPECIQAKKVIDSLLISKTIKNKTLQYEQISGIGNASDKNWKSLKEYSDSLIPRNRWNTSQSEYYGFDTDKDFDYLSQIVMTGKNYVGPFINGIEYHSWTGRYYINNTDGSHRCAALFRQNYEQNRKLQITTILREYFLNEDLFDHFLTGYYFIITSEYAAQKLANLCKNLLFCSNTEANTAILTPLIIKKTDSLFEKHILSFLRVFDPDKLIVIDKNNYKKIIDDELT